MSQTFTSPFHGTVMHFDQPLDQGQSDAQTACRSIKSLIDLREQIEHSIQHFSRDADSRVSRRRPRQGRRDLVHRAQEARAAARILEGGFGDMPVTRVLVERWSRWPRSSTRPSRSIGPGRTWPWSPEGGVDIEETARTNPSAIRRAAVDPLLGLKDYQVRYLAGHLPEAARAGTDRPVAEA